MSEQELNMMGDERGKDEASASDMLKRHDILEAAIADYAETVNDLGEHANMLIDNNHPERWVHDMVVCSFTRSLIHFIHSFIRSFNFSFIQSLLMSSYVTFTNYL